MALSTNELNKNLSTLRNNQVNYVERVKESQEKLFAKQATSLGGTAGQVIEGIKGLDAVTNAPNEIVSGENACLITDDLTNLSGVTDPVNTLLNYSAASTILNFDGLDSGFDSEFVISAAKSGGDTPSSISSVIEQMTGVSTTAAAGINAVGGGGLNGVVANATAAVEKQNAIVNDIKTAAADVASATELSEIASVAQDVAAGAFNDIAEKLTPIASLKKTKSPSDLRSAVSNSTGISGLTAKLTSAKNVLDKVPSVNSLLGKVPTALGGVTDLLSDAKELGEKIQSGTDSLIDAINEGLTGILQNVSEKLTGAAKSKINGFLPGGATIDDQEMKDILAQFAEGTPASQAKAVVNIAKNNTELSDEMRGVIASAKGETQLQLQEDVIRRARELKIPEEDITESINFLSYTDAELKKLDTTIAGSKVIDSNFFGESVNISKNNTDWTGRTSPDDVFTYIASKEELESEVRTIIREVTEVIIHATETYTDKDIGSIEINNIHKELGYDGIGYHYVIRRDGRLQRGRPVNRVGEHTEGRNRNSIGVVMVGGINVSSGTKDPLSYLSAQSFTRAQYTTLETLLGAIYKRYHGMQVFGHNDIDDEQQDPYFDVPDYVGAVFRKYNAVSQFGTKNPKNTGALTPSVFNTRNVSSIGTADLVDKDGEPQPIEENINYYGFDGAPNQTDRKETNSTPDKLEKAGIPLSTAEKDFNDSTDPNTVYVDNDGTQYYWETDPDTGEKIKVVDYSNSDFSDDTSSPDTVVYSNNADIDVDDI